MVWYFAYGSNLDMNQMEERVGSRERCQRALLRGWKLTFNVSSSIWGGKAANIFETRDPKDIVYGVIYQIREAQLDELTQKEGPKPLDLEVESAGNKIMAKAYVFNPNARPGQPTKEYLDKVVSGLQQHGYGENVIGYVKKLAHESK